MPGIKIEQRVIQDITDMNGWPLQDGNMVVIRLKKKDKTEDILCSFHGIDGGYLVTKTTDGTITNRYRLTSIDQCHAVERIIFKEEDGHEQEQTPE